MDLPEQVFRVGADDTRETLLARIGAATTPKVVLRVTREASVPRSIEDFQALKSLARRHNLRLRIVSPVASVVGLAKIYDIEAEFDATVGKTDALKQAAAAAAPPPALTPLPPPAPPPPLTPLPSITFSPAPPPATAIPPAAIPPPSENDWLFGGLDVETIDSDFASERGRSAAPPPEFLSGTPGWPATPLPAASAPVSPPVPSPTLPPPVDFSVAPPPPADLPPAPLPPAPSDNDWLFGGLDVETIDSDFANDRGRSAAPPPEALNSTPLAAPESPPRAPTALPSAAVTPPPAPPEPLPTPGIGPRTPAAPPEAPPTRDPLQNSVFLPDWLRTIPTGVEPLPPLEETPPPAPPPAPTPPPAVPAPTPAAAISAPPLFAHGPATKPGPRWTVPCPHCGEPMDLELLIQNADYQD